MKILNEFSSKFSKKQQSILKYLYNNSNFSKLSDKYSQVVFCEVTGGPSEDGIDIVIPNGLKDPREFNQNGVAVCLKTDKDSGTEYKLLAFYDTSDYKEKEDAIRYDVSRHIYDEVFDDKTSGNPDLLILDDKGKLIRTDTDIQPKLFSKPHKYAYTKQFSNLSITEFLSKKGWVEIEDDKGLWTIPNKNHWYGSSIISIDKNGNPGYDSDDLLAENTVKEWLKSSKQFSTVSSQWKHLEKVIKKYNLRQFDDNDLTVGDYILQPDVDETKPVRITKVRGNDYWVEGGDPNGYYWSRDNDNYGIKASDK